MSVESLPPLLYVAAPYTNPDPVENTHAAIKACDELRASGVVTPFCPHLSLLWHVVSPQPYDVWLDYDLGVLRHCHALLRLPGESSGADGEVAEARRLGMPVFYAMEHALRWARATTIQRRVA